VSATAEFAETSLLQSARIQLRVIHALFLRELLTRYGRHNIGFLWIFVEPMIFTLGVTALWTATQSVHGSNLPIVAFAITGYSTVLLWRNMPSRCILAITYNSAIMYHRQVKVIDIYLARILLEAIGASMSFFFLSAFFIFIDWMAPPEDLLLVVFAWVTIALFGASLAIFLASLSERFEIIEKLWHPTSYLVFPLSGAAFLVSTLPKAAQDIVLYFPMVHGTEMLREGYFGTKVDTIYDVGYLVASTLVMMCLGLALSRRVTDYVVPE
jgi:ABC-2 type transport system permease protein/capsular polysaccharide transport system permease protein